MRGRAFTICAFFVFFLSIEAYAKAPAVNVKRGNPQEQTEIPYRIEFSVSDDKGLSSITVNGTEILNGAGGTYYDCDWSVLRNGPITITAVDNDGESSSATVQITNLLETGWKPAVQETVAATQMETIPPTQPETTAAVPGEIILESVKPAETVPPETVRETVAKETEAPKEPETEPETEEEVIREVILPTEERKTEEETKASVILPPVPDHKEIIDAAAGKGSAFSIRIPKAVLVTDIGVRALKGKETLTIRRPEGKLSIKIGELAAIKGQAFTPFLEEQEETVEALINVLKASEQEGMLGILKLMLISLSCTCALYNVLVIRLNRKRLYLYRLYMNAAKKRRRGIERNKKISA